ncbi:subtilisin-like protease, partial [Trifolium medium]|nr:subtilisin-like protease [Trifolium medium]
TTQVNNNAINNNNRRDMREEPIRVRNGGNNRVIEDSSSEEEVLVDEGADGRGNHHDYRVKADIPLFYGTMGVEEFLDW